MPTKKPHLITYPDTALFERLKRYQEAKGIKTLSKTVIEILEEYFKQMDRSSNVEFNDIELLKREFAEIAEQLRGLSDKATRIEQQSKKSGKT